MQMLSTCATLASVCAVVVLGACQPRNQDNGAPAGLPPTGYPTYPPGQTPTAYPTGQVPPGYPAPGTAPTAAPNPAPAGSAQMAVPGPLALQCSNDVPCGTHRCNLQYGKCAFPCQSAADCLAPNSCAYGVCLPVGGATH